MHGNEIITHLAEEKRISATNQRSNGKWNRLCKEKKTRREVKATNLQYLRSFLLTIRACRRLSRKLLRLLSCIKAACWHPSVSDKVRRTRGKLVSQLVKALMQVHGPSLRLIHFGIAERKKEKIEDWFLRAIKAMNASPEYPGRCKSGAVIRQSMVRSRVTEARSEATRVSREENNNNQPTYNK